MADDADIIRKPRNAAEKNRDEICGPFSSVSWSQVTTAVGWFTASWQSVPPVEHWLVDCKTTSDPKSPVACRTRAHSTYVYATRFRLCPIEIRMENKFSFAYKYELEQLNVLLFLDNIETLVPRYTHFFCFLFILFHFDSLAFCRPHPLKFHASLWVTHPRLWFPSLSLRLALPVNLFPLSHSVLIGRPGWAQSEAHIFVHCSLGRYAYVH